MQHGSSAWQAWAAQYPEGTWLDTTCTAGKTVSNVVVAVAVKRGSMADRPVGLMGSFDYGLCADRTVRRADRAQRREHFW